tara:strand:- start:489 stop:1124 length:636 start_codon:yes stop_codon:yes gene_type:complete
MAVVTLKQFLKKDFLEKTVRNSAAVASQSDLIIKRKVAGLKGVALREFDRHPVSREIAQGPEGINLSNTLSGEGNLFTFIGFNKSSDPLTPVREVLKGNLNLVSRQKKKRGSKNMITGFTYELSFPTFAAFDLVSRMPWESGNSWVEGIEKGISGYSNYMYFKFGEGKASLAAKSRSGKAIQVKKNINMGIFKTTKYITEILTNYRRRLED